MGDNVFTVTDQINTVLEGFRHIVILGAGASKASCMDRPEGNGKSIPLMNDLSSIIDLSNELKDLPKSFGDKDFEQIFSTLFDKEAGSKRLQAIENKIYRYFSSLELPETPTIYDHLILSLRKKDLIATFNWDPFLWQAYERNSKFTTNLPDLAFLHGNVAIGLSEESKTFGPLGKFDLKTGKPYLPTKLFYPIEHKNYTSDPFIIDQWNLLLHKLKSPARVTIFGYSAPVSDVAAISLMKKTWGDPESNHRFTQFEIIDIQSEEKLLASWKGFIFSHHYEIYDDFFKSTIFKFPRRTGEVFNANILEAKFYEENYPPKFNTLQDMWEWYSPFVENENHKG